MVMNADGTGQRMLTRDSFNYHGVRWRSDREIICTGYSGVIFAFDPDTGRRRNLWGLGGGQPGFSPDGERLAFFRNWKHVHVYREGFRKPVAVTRPIPRSVYPVWIGNTWIVFSSKHESKNDDLYLMRIDGTGLERLTETPEAEQATDAFVAPEGDGR